MRSNAYGFLDGTVLDILNKEGVIVGKYEEALVELNLMGVRTSQTSSVLFYFLDKAKELGYLTERTQLGFNVGEVMYYFGTSSQLTLVGAEVIPYSSSVDIPRGEYQSWKEARLYDKSSFVLRSRILGSLAVTLGLTTLVLGSILAFNTNEGVKSDKKVVTSSSKVVSKPKATEVEVDTSKVSELEQRISALSSDLVSSSDELDSIKQEISNLGVNTSSVGLLDSLSSKLSDITLYKEISQKLDTYPTDAESYVYIEKGINSFSNFSENWKNELLEKERLVKEYLTSMGYEL